MLMLSGVGLWLWLRPVDGEFWRVTVQEFAEARGLDERASNARFLRNTALSQCGWTFVLCVLGLLIAPTRRAGAVASERLACGDFALGDARSGTGFSQ